MEELIGLLIALSLWIGTLVFFRINRVWLPFYVLGSVGLAALIIYTGRGILPLEQHLKNLMGLSVNWAASQVGIPTQLFDRVPGAILVLVVFQQAGWTVIHIDIECSGLLEASIMVGLLSFYPSWSLAKKVQMITIGLFATYLANLIRMMSIVGILHWGGKDTLFVAHTVVGRAIFFGIIVMVYWMLLTKPTIRTIGERLRRGATH